MVHCSGMLCRIVSRPFRANYLCLCGLLVAGACGGAPLQPPPGSLGQELPADPAVEAGGHIAQAGEKTVYDRPPKRAKPKQGARGRGRDHRPEQEDKAEPPAPQADAEPTQEPEEAPAAPEAAAPADVETPDDVAAPPSDAVLTRTGVYTKVLKAGTGLARPASTAKVRVHYSGWTTDGKLFDSSVVRGQSIVLPLSGVIPGWSEGVQLMVAGEKRRLWIPEALAYKGRAGAPKGMLVFDIELLEIQ